jgi:hypothetical protein
MPVSEDALMSPQRIDYYDSPEAPRANSLVPGAHPHQRLPGTQRVPGDHLTPVLAASAGLHTGVD